MPYPLPDDIGGVTGLRWFLVAVPDDVAYTRAAMDRYTDLANYWQWGMEGPIPIESDLAAQQWANAVDETLRALEMGFPDILLGYIDGIEALLTAIRDKPVCCDNYGFGAIGDDTNTGGATDIVDSVGDPPDTWGGDPVADWGEWNAWKCGAAFAMAGQPGETMRRLGNIAQHEDAAGWTEFLATALSFIPIAGAFAALLFEWVGAILVAGLDWVVDFEGAANEIDAAEDDIACAIFQADGVEAAATAMQAAVVDAITGTAAKALAGYFPYQMWTNIIYQGYFIDDDGNTVDLDTIVTPSTNCCGNIRLAIYDGSAYSTHDYSGSVVINSFTASVGGGNFSENVTAKFEEFNGTAWVNVDHEVDNITFPGTVPVNQSAQGTYSGVRVGMGVIYDSDTKPSMPWLVNQLNIFDYEGNPTPDPFSALVTWTP